MARRLYLAPGRVILSRPGYNASPSLANNRKIFDSDWGYAGSLVAAGEFTDPAAPAGGNASSPYTNTSTPIVVMFPQNLGFIPTVILQEKRIDSEGFARYRSQEFFLNNQPGNGRMFDIVVGTDRMTFNRNPGGSGLFWRYRFTVAYQIFSWN